MAKQLDSPDVRVRLQALDRWGQQAPTESVDLLLLALEDEDERVQARALALIEQDERDWGRAQATEK
jgi:HEAT repeat protein